MQKKIIAVAVAGLSTAAFAQTNVTIYGVADVSAQGYTMSANKAQPFEGGSADTNAANKVAAGNLFALQSNSSLLGFKGTEDLGNGLKALFQAETTLYLTGTSSAGVAASPGGSLWGAAGMRDSFVGLNSKYGTAMAGFLSTPYRSSLTSFDVMPGATGSGQIEKMMGTMRFTGAMDGSPSSASTEFGSSIRATAIAYAMPTLYGFNGSIAYTGSNANGQNNNQAYNTNSGTSQGTQAPMGALSLNLGWTGYGVNVQGAFQQAKYNLTDTATTGEVYNLPAGAYTSYLIGTSYTGIPGLKASVVYNRNTLGVNQDNVMGDFNGASKLTNNQLYTGVSYRMGNWEPRLSAAWTSGINGSSEVGASGARQWTLNTGYYLSKRTQVYGVIANMNNSGNQNYSLGQQSNQLRPTGGQNLFTYGMGMRTTF